MTEPTANPLAVLGDIAHTQIGVHETSENTGPQVQLYQRATDEPGTGWPWCAAFVCWCVRDLARLRPGLLSCEAHNCLPREASVEGFYEWAVRTRQWVVPSYDPGTARPVIYPLYDEGFRPQAGDIVLMRFPSGRHCGIVNATPYPSISGLSVPTIEGNTSGPYHATVDERNGGEVAAKTRPISCITHFIRLTLQAQPVNPSTSNA